jgi:hypothetical protein
MKNILIILLAIFPLAIEACPISPKEDHLTISRVMRNFGRYSRDAESLALTGKDFPLDVKESILDKAISDLNIVVTCAEAVINNPTGDLLPVAVDDYTGFERENYILKFINFMHEFKASTLHFQSLLITEKNKNLADRNYQIAYEYTKKFNEIIDLAHKEL